MEIIVDGVEGVLSSTNRTFDKALDKIIGVIKQKLITRLSRNGSEYTKGVDAVSTFICWQSY